MPNLEQQRAAFALRQIEAVAQEERFARDRPKYKTQLLKLPARLHTNGLGPTVAFYLAAGRDREGNPAPEVDICGWIEDWLHQVGVYPGMRLVHGVTGTNLAGPASEAFYRRASAETRALAVWLKRFAEAFIEGRTE